MFSTPKGDMTQRERDDRLHHTTPLKRITASIDHGIELAEKSDATRARIIRVLAAIAITAGGFVGLDHIAQKVDPEVMSMTPQQLASKILQREIQ